MNPAKLSTAMQRGEHLARVQQPLRVECTFQALLLVEIDLGEHRPHQIAFFDADTVLSGKHAADLHAQPQNVGTERLGPIQLTGGS